MPINAPGATYGNANCTSISPDMKASKPSIVLNLYDWLPPYGETKVIFKLEGSDLAAQIQYDSPDKTAELQKIILFKEVYSTLITSVPGVKVTAIEYSKADLSGGLVEYQESEAALNWTQQLAWRKSPVRHFQLFFQSENRKLEVFAGGFVLIDGKSNAVASND